MVLNHKIWSSNCMNLFATCEISMAMTPSPTPRWIGCWPCWHLTFLEGFKNIKIANLCLFSWRNALCNVPMKLRCSFKQAALFMWEALSFAEMHGCSRIAVHTPNVSEMTNWSSLKQHDFWIPLINNGAQKSTSLISFKICRVVDFWRLKFGGSSSLAHVLCLVGFLKLTCSWRSLACCSWRPAQKEALCETSSQA